MTNKSQCERIIEILERDGQIDNFYAIHSRISLRLGARIWDLRHQGWEINTEQRDDKNTVYRLIAKPQPRCETCEWRASEIGYSSPCSAHQPKQLALQDIYDQ
jgi:hypothetical protein